MSSESGGSKAVGSMAEETQGIYIKRDNAYSVVSTRICCSKRRGLGYQGNGVWVDVGRPPAQAAS